jgi:hypothetical protein
MNMGNMLFGRRIRQNHALEHGTVTILTREQPDLVVSARSNARGFIIFANIDLGLVRRSCEEALFRFAARISPSAPRWR